MDEGIRQEQAAEAAASEAAEHAWDKPIEVDDVTLAFPADVMNTLMPPHDECEAALDAMPDRGEKWRDVQRTWFFNGLNTKTTFMLRDGIDGKLMMRHLGAIQGSFEPKHEHKEAAVAYLLSLWCEDVKDYK